LTIITRGEAVHAAQPERGVNAIYKMADIIHALRAVVLPSFESRPPHPMLGRPSMSVGVISGGSNTNIVPDFCRLEVDIRTLPGGEDILSFVKGIILRACPDAEVEAVLSSPMETDPNHPTIQRLLGCGSHLIGAPWFSDASVFAQSGIPAIALGPGSIHQAHTPDEWMKVADLEEGARFFTEFLSNLTEADLLRKAV
jgi:acetylornithine deacetylase/succinyl-diaminopimelate desuccinylase-like protein